jgi:hypothetical protein
MPQWFADHFAYEYIPFHLDQLQRLFIYEIFHLSFVWNAAFFFQYDLHDHNFTPYFWHSYLHAFYKTSSHLVPITNTMHICVQWASYFAIFQDVNIIAFMDRVAVIILTLCLYTIFPFMLPFHLLYRHVLPQTRFCNYRLKVAFKDRFYPI